MGKYSGHDNENYLLENNLLGIKSKEQLKEAEAFAFSIRAAELERQEFVLNTFCVATFKKLHFHLFQDIYPFAGQFRNVQLMKGNTRFCQYQHIENSSFYLFKKLNKEPAWNSLEDAAHRLAFFKSELNMIHPFREGNGRTIRIFTRLFALTKEVVWDFEIMNKEKYMQAMIQSVINPELLSQLFLDTITWSD